MTRPPTSEIAREVDRLVIGIHRDVMSRHRSRLQDLAGSIGVTSPGHFYDLAEFLAAGACTIDIARRRFRYEADNTAETLIGGLHDRELVDDQLRPAEQLAEAVATILRWRAESAANLWGTDLTTASRGAAEALPHASGPLIEAFRSLPEPTPPAHRLHHRLTGLRYARLDAHVAAWEEVDLTAVEIVALTSAITSEPVSPALEALVTRGWLTDSGTATTEGHAARSSIEVDTNARCDELFDVISHRREWLTAMQALAPDDR